MQLLMVRTIKSIRHLLAQFRKHTKSLQMQPVHASLPDVFARRDYAKLENVGASRKGQSVAVDVVAMAIVMQMSITVNDQCDKMV